MFLANIWPISTQNGYKVLVCAYPYKTYESINGEAIAHWFVYKT